MAAGTAGTVQSTYEVSGPTTLIACMNPLMRTFRKGSFDLLVRRIDRLTGKEGEAFAALGDLIDSGNVPREGMVATSFDVALGKFNRSHSSVACLLAGTVITCGCRSVS